MMWYRPLHLVGASLDHGECLLPARMGRRSQYRISSGDAGPTFRQWPALSLIFFTLWPMRWPGSIYPFWMQSAAGWRTHAHTCTHVMATEKLRGPPDTQTPETNVDSTLAERLRRWPSIESTLVHSFELKLGSQHELARQPNTNQTPKSAATVTAARRQYRQSSCLGHTNTRWRDKIGSMWSQPQCVGPALGQLGNHTSHH